MGGIFTRLLLGYLLVYFVAGAFFVLLSVVGLRATDHTEFCVSCHTMKHLYKETRNSRHYKNMNGVKIECSDCHIPDEIGGYLKRKLIASKDVFFELIRPAKTREEYERIRPRLVKEVREQYLKDDSAACRKCHAYANFSVQIKAHKRAVKEKITCIVCHYNLVHGEIPWPEIESED